MSESLRVIRRTAYRGLVASWLRLDCTCPTVRRATLELALSCIDALAATHGRGKGTL